jgi:osmoprotectant transport system permease protein
VTLNGVLGAAPTAWQYISDHRHKILHLFYQHVQLTVIAVLVGLAISIPLALYSYRHPRIYGPIASATGILYTIPSIALFVALVPITGLHFRTVEIGLVSYTLLILIRNIVVGLRGVPEDVKEAARGMGYTERQLLWRIELPLALPAVMAGVRIATVSTIGLVTIASLIGLGGLGEFILEGLNTFYRPEILLGALLSVAFALVADGGLLLLQRRLTPWSRAAFVRTFG